MGTRSCLTLLEQDFLGSHSPKRNRHAPCSTLWAVILWQKQMGSRLLCTSLHIGVHHAEVSHPSWLIGTAPVSKIKWRLSLCLQTEMKHLSKNTSLLCLGFASPS